MMVRRSLYEQLMRELRKIRWRLDDIERSISNWKPQPLQVSESELFTLPDHLRKTYLALASKGECDATEVSNVTGRSRAIESSYLNSLARAGWVTKRRESKAILFRPAKTLENVEKKEKFR